MKVAVGTAGWTVPALVRDRFGDGPSALSRRRGTPRRERELTVHKETIDVAA